MEGCQLLCYAISRMFLSFKTNFFLFYGVTNEELKVLWRAGSLQPASLKVSRMCIIWWVTLPSFTGKKPPPKSFILIKDNKRQDKELIRISLDRYVYVRQWEQHYWSVPNIRQKEEGKTSGRGERSAFLLSAFLIIPFSVPMCSNILYIFDISCVVLPN